MHVMALNFQPHSWSLRIDVHWQHMRLHLQHMHQNAQLGRSACAGTDHVGLSSWVQSVQCYSMHKLDQRPQAQMLSFGIPQNRGPDSPAAVP